MFDPERDLVIQYFGGDRAVQRAEPAELYRVRTLGLSRHGHREIELLGVPAELSTEAAILLNRVAAYSMNKRGLGHGSRWAARLQGGFLVAAFCAEVTHRGEAVLRVLDFERPDLDRPASAALCAITVERALALRDADRADEALDALLACTRWYPGEPGPGVPVNAGENANQNNNLGWLALEAFGHDPLRSYENALVRSDILAQYELGGALPATVSHAQLTSDAAAVVLAMQRAVPPAEGAPGDFGMLLSPVLSCAADGFIQSLAMGPRPFRSYYFDGPVRAALRDPQVLDVVARIYVRWASAPAGALVLSRETCREIYEEGYRLEGDDRPIRAVANVGATPAAIPLLSRILASVGRELAAGCTLDEIAARWWLGNVASKRARAEAKLSLLREREQDVILAELRAM